MVMKTTLVDVDINLKQHVSTLMVIHLEDVYVIYLLPSKSKPKKIICLTRVLKPSAT